MERAIEILTRPIAGIENRSAQEVFDIMADRIRRTLPGEPTAAETYRLALEEIVDPLRFMRERAEASGDRLSGMAYSIANDMNHLRGIACAALTLSPSPSGDATGGGEVTG